MKKYLLTIPLLFLLTSCAYPTDQEIAEKKKMCDIGGDMIAFNQSNNWLYCKPKEDNEVMKCIKEYTR